jgi:hypothetical protein
MPQQKHHFFLVITETGDKSLLVTLYQKSKKFFTPPAPIKPPRTNRPKLLFIHPWNQGGVVWASYMVWFFKHRWRPLAESDCYLLFRNIPRNYEHAARSWDRRLLHGPSADFLCLLLIVPNRLPSSQISRQQSWSATRQLPLRGSANAPPWMNPAMGLGRTSVSSDHLGSCVLARPEKPMKAKTTGKDRKRIMVISLRTALDSRG